MTICKKHPSEPPVGVCACCLRDRLLGLQACVTPRACAAPSSSSSSAAHKQGRNRPLFFGAGPLPPAGAGTKRGGFSVLSTLFGTPPGGGPSPSSAGERCGGPGGYSPQRPDRAVAAAPPSFSSWLAALFAVRCKRNRRRSSGAAGVDTLGAGSSSAGSSALAGIENRVQPDAPRQRPACSRFQRYRGMSPGSEQEDDDEGKQQQQQEVGGDDRAAAAASPSGSSGSFSDGLPALAGPTPARNFWCRNPTAVRTGFAVCFSPLVRARPHHHRRARVVAGDTGGGGAHCGELQKPGLRLRRHGQQPPQHHQPHRPRHAGVKLCPNRSRKLVDLGRFR